MNEPGIDLTGKLIIKVALGDDIRRILITNEDITYDELVLMMQRVYRGKLNSTDDIVIKYKDEDNDLITIFDSSDLSFATQCSRILKITLFVNSKPEPLQTDEIKMIKTELKHIRDRCTKLLDRLDDREVPDFPSSTVDSTTNKTGRLGNTSDSPRRAAAPSPRMQTPTNAAGSKEFDPFSRQRSTDDHQEKVLSSFNINNDNERSGTPDSISSIGSAGQRQAGQPTPQPTPQGPPQPTPQGPAQPNQGPPQPTSQGGPQPTPQGNPQGPPQQSQQPQQPVQPGMYPGGGPSGAQKMSPWQQQNTQPYPGQQQQQGFPASSQHQGLPGQQQHSPASQGPSVPTSASTGSSFVPPGSPYHGYSQPGQPGGAMQYGAQQQSGQYGGQQPGQTGPPGQTGHPQQQQQQQPPQAYYQQPAQPGPPGPGGNNPYARQGPGYGVGYPKPAASYPQGYQ